MTRVKVAAGVLNQTPMDWAGNKRNIIGAVEAARARQVSLLCLPELCICGYGCEDAFQSESLANTAIEVLREILPATEGLIISLGLPLLHRNRLYNAAALAVDGRIAGFSAKRFLAGDGLHYEPRWFQAWPENFCDIINMKGRQYPIGDMVFDCGGVKLGFEICEEAWVANRPAARMSLDGVDIILNPSASHFAFGKAEIRKRLVLEGSRAFGVGYVFANLLGNEAGRSIYDGGALVASCGQLLAEGPRLSFEPFHLTTAVIDTASTRMARARSANFPPSDGATGCSSASASLDSPKTLADKQPMAPFSSHVQKVRPLVTCDFAWPDIEPQTPRPEAAAWQSSRCLKEEEFTHAVGLGLFDYLRKSRARGFVVSLSGGADSSTVASLVSLMTALACDEIGRQAFTEALAHIPDLAEAESPRQLTERLLHCVYQASKNSSATTRNAATDVAEALGAKMSCLEIDDLVEGYVSGIERVLGRKLAWETDDVALQNIQARVRGPSVWLLANVKGALLLATSNRSEAAVGYATMDGDTCGGLSPIAGIDKAFLRRWLVWLEKQGPLGLSPIPALAAVNCLEPTAELRPGAARQTDEDDLMPYEVLDVAERAAIRDKQSPVEVFRLLRSQFGENAAAGCGIAGYSIGQLHQWVRRFFRLWCQNQWKRERYAPSFHLDDENLDPKTWCRFPILSGGFQRELGELDEFVARLNAKHEDGEKK